MYSNNSLLKKLLLTSSATCDVKHGFTAAKKAKKSKTTGFFSIVKNLGFFLQSPPDMRTKIPT